MVGGAMVEVSVVRNEVDGGMMKIATINIIINLIIVTNTKVYIQYFLAKGMEPY